MAAPRTLQLTLPSLDRGQAAALFDLCAVGPQQDEQQQDEHDDAPDADLVGPDDPGRARCLPWADRFQRVWRADVLRCSKCSGEMRLIAVVQDPPVCEKILRHLGLWQRGPPRARRVVLDPATLA